MHISMCQWRGLRSIVAVSFMHRLKTKSSTKGVCPHEQDVVRGSISLSARTHGSEKKTKRNAHMTPACAPAVLMADIMYFCHSFDITGRERERDECEQRQQTLLTGNERVREVRSHHPRLSHSVISLLFWRLLEVYFLPLVQLTVSPVYNMLGIFQRAEQCCVQV